MIAHVLKMAIALALLPALWGSSSAVPLSAPVAAPRSAAGEAHAHWLSRDLIAWNAPDGEAAVLLTDQPGADGNPTASHPLERIGIVDDRSVPGVPHLRGTPLYRITGASRAEVGDWLKGRIRVASMTRDGSIVAETGVQIGGVLDDLYANDAPLGVGFDRGVPTIALWAPTARKVRLLLFDGPKGAPVASSDMREDAATGIWRITGKADWNRHYYLFEVDVFVPALGRVVTNRVTDPYSLNLSTDSERSQIVNLDDPDLQPNGWRGFARALPEAPEDIVISELHVRDFSIGDATVPVSHRGTYLAFTDVEAAGMRHLSGLAKAGLSHLHLLPTYDCATVPEDRRRQQSPPPRLSAFGLASERQKAAIAKIRDSDGYNWCYDPFHYMAPEGSYATSADGTARIVEFRRMVMALGKSDLAVVLDVVFNHTSAAGQARTSVLDRIVPGYYHRLDKKGAVATSTCCANTASERAMMQKLMIDAMLVWARDYKVGGFRFDLMGHHSRATILAIRDRLRTLTLARDGVDGAHLYLYGEGWNFGEIANDARFVQATQRHMGEGTGVGTFNDYFRDAIRGGGYSDSGLGIVRSQGFANGLFTAPNAENTGSAAERGALLELSDRIRIGLAGSVGDFSLTMRDGSVRRAGAVTPGGGNPLGYVSDPQETINYAEAHDNETLFDINAYKLPRTTSREDRMRAQNLAASLILLAQGVPFLHAGQELLRSKSLDRNSHDSGEWFNLLDYSMRSNGWGRGLPLRGDNAANWPVQRMLLADRRIAVGQPEIAGAAAHVREMLAIRRSSPLFRLRTADEIVQRLHFHNVGPTQQPGLIVMSLDGRGGTELVVVFNATRKPIRFPFPAGDGFRLHPIQQASADRRVRTANYGDGAFQTPALTTAVFVAKPH